MRNTITVSQPFSGQTIKSSALPRPKTSVTKRSINVYAEAVPMHRRIRRAYHMSTMSHFPPCSLATATTPFCRAKDTVDSEQPEAVYNLLDEFDNAIAKKSVGTPFEYPLAKYEQSKRLVSSRGYKRVKMMQKEERVPAFILEMRQELREIHRRVELTEDEGTRQK